MATNEKWHDPNGRRMVLTRTSTGYSLSTHHDPEESPFPEHPTMTLHAITALDLAEFAMNSRCFRMGRVDPPIRCSCGRTGSLVENGLGKEGTFRIECECGMCGPWRWEETGAIQAFEKIAACTQKKD